MIDKVSDKDSKKKYLKIGNQRLIQPHMKATTLKISKSNVMKRAWSIYRGESFYSRSFSLSLERAWEVEKATLAYNIQKQKYAELFSPDTNYKNDSVSIEKIAQEEARALTAYYSRGSGVFCGD